MWILPGLIAKARGTSTSWAGLLERDGEHTVLLNSVKQIGLYTDCYAKVHWSEPEKVVDAELARPLVKIAESPVGVDKLVTVRERDCGRNTWRP